MGQPLADCDFNRAALHPAYPIKRRTSAQRTQASPERRHPEEPLALDDVDGCAGRPAEGRRCKSVTVKAQRATPTPSHARAVVRLQAKR